MTPAILAEVFSAYRPIGILIGVAVLLVTAMSGLSHWIGTYRTGATKASPYESGMPVIGDARRRFNVKFYLVAMLFLLFDVEIVFLWPWAPLFHKASTQGDPGQALHLLVAMLIFFAILLVGYIYAWRRGVFRWS